MRYRSISAVAIAAVLGGASSTALAQLPIAPKAQQHMDIAKALTGTRDAAELYANACGPIGRASPPGRGANAASEDGEAPRPRGGQPLDPNRWNAKPFKIFDNAFYNVGTPGISSIVVTTSDGLVLMDAANDRVLEGIRTLGLDPRRIRYVIISHAHGDHSGGAKFLQAEIPGIRIISSDADWQQMERGAVAATADQRPKRDMVIRDGEKLTVGDTTITFYVTPAHTAGMVSPLVPVFDNGKPHLAAQWGGLGAGLRGDVNGKFGPGDEAYFRQYAASAFRYRDIITAAGADVMFAPHPTQAGAGWKAEALFARKPGDPNPFVIGKDAVRDAMTVIAECATAQAEQVAMYPNPG